MLETNIYKFHFLLHSGAYIIYYISHSCTHFFPKTLHNNFALTQFFSKPFSSLLFSFIFSHFISFSPTKHHINRFLQLKYKQLNSQMISTIFSVSRRVRTYGDQVQLRKSLISFLCDGSIYMLQLLFRINKSEGRV